MNAKKMIVVNVIILIILVGGGFAGYYYYNKSITYLSTDNAQITGQQVHITSPAGGQLTDWHVTIGDTFMQGDVLGAVQIASQQGTVAMDIVAPTNGTIVQTNAIENTMVGAGTPLAISYDLNSLWVTANIKETDLNNIKVGQDADIYVDAFPDSTFHGTVEEIGLATAGTFSLLPVANASGNYTKETQVIPVRVSINGYADKLIPGLNVTVRIHK